MDACDVIRAKIATDEVKKKKTKIIKKYVNRTVYTIASENINTCGEMSGLECENYANRIEYLYARNETAHKCHTKIRNSQFSAILSLHRRFVEMKIKNFFRGFPVFSMIIDWSSDALNKIWRKKKRERVKLWSHCAHTKCMHTGRHTMCVCVHLVKFSYYFSSFSFLVNLSPFCS